MGFDRQRAAELLRLGTGHSDACFRPGQEESIRHVVEGRGRLLVVQRTGWGKSIVYFIATKMLRDSGSGPALLVSPLLALMRDQIRAAERMGVRAVTINSDNTEEWNRVEEHIRQDEIDVLLISPERFANERFRREVLPKCAGRISLLVVDEAHCISDWGHDFRPHYRLVERIARRLPPTLRLLGTTATANQRVMDDLKSVLGPGLHVMRGSLHRSSLMLQTIRLPSQAERLAWLAEQVPRLPGSGVIYTLTVRDANQVAEWLRSRNLVAESYTGESGDRRPALEQALLENKVKALVATTALGMGFDKPDLAFVIHYQAPGSVVSYYQQIGRAGRRLPAAHCILLSGAEDTEIIEHFIRSAFPTREEARQVLDALAASPEGLSVYELMARVNVTKGRIEKTIELLSLESPAPFVKQGSKWMLTASELSETFWQRAERLTTLRHAEREQMQAYVNLTSGHMDFLIRALDGDPAVPYSLPKSPPLPQNANPVIIAEAVAFLGRACVVLKPRRQWPAGGLQKYSVRGIIPPALIACEGRALCSWGDAGWGEFVRTGKYRDGRYDQQLVDACSRMIQEWNPEPRPTWVTCVPSLRHPDLVPDLARRLAMSLGIPFQPVLAKTIDSPEQKAMANSVQQARNLDGTLDLIIPPVRGAPVFLVDDMVDSKWTMTVASWLLRANGSGPVFPLALAYTGHGG